MKSDVVLLLTMPVTSSVVPVAMVMVPLLALPSEAMVPLTVERVPELTKMLGVQELLEPRRSTSPRPLSVRFPGPVSVPVNTSAAAALLVISRSLVRFTGRVSVDVLVALDMMMLAELVVEEKVRKPEVTESKR